MFFEFWNVTKYEGKVSPVVQEDDDETVRIVIIVAVCIVLVFLLFMILVWRWRKKQKRKLKAVTISALQSDAELKSVSNPDMNIHSQKLSSPFQYDDPVPYQVNTLSMPDTTDNEMPKEPSSSKFTSFYGGYTLEAEEDNGSLYIEPVTEEENAIDDCKFESLTLLDVIAKQELKKQQDTGVTNAAMVDDDEYFSDEESMTSSRADIIDGINSQPTSDTVFVDVPAVPQNIENIDNDERCKTVRLNGVLITSM